jgi:hypothetical protein
MALQCRVGIAFTFFLIRPMGSESFHADGRTQTQTDMTQVIVTFRNFANALKTYPRKSCLKLLETSQLIPEANNY